jgi:hypothetical protein
MRAAVPVLAASAFLLTGLGRASQPVPADTPAVAAARARQEAVKTLSIRFQRTEVVAKGSKSEMAPPSFRPTNPVPASEITIESINRLVIDGKQYRYEDNHSDQLLPAGTLLRLRRIGVSNGTVAKSFFSNDSNKAGTPSGSIEENAAHSPLKCYLLTPITLTFRGLDPAFCAYPVSEMQPSGVTLPIDGAPCQEYVVKYLDNGTISFWLDPGQDYVIRRTRLQRPKQPVVQNDIHYRRDETGGWVPTSWICCHYSPAGTLLTTEKVDVLDLRINEPQPAEQFDVSFPERSLVYDRRVHKEYRIQADGSMREVAPGGEELPGVAAPSSDSWYRRHLWLLIGLGAAILLWIVQYTLRRRASV